MKKKSLVLLVIMLMVVTSILAACGSGKSESTDTSAPSIAPSGAVSVAPSTDASASLKGEVNVLIGESQLGSIHDDLVKEFEAKYPDIKIKVEALPDGGIFDALRTKIATADMPDLYQINIGHVTTGLADQSGYIYDLKDMDAMANYLDSVKGASIYNGKVADFSLGSGVLGLDYDKKALAALGYTEPFKTWDEMIAAGKKLKEQGKDLLVYSSKWETAISNIFHWTFGHKAILDPEFKKTYLTNSIDWTKAGYRDVLVEGFKRFKELNQFVRVGSFTNEVEVARQSFTNGESLTLIGGSWEAGSIHKLNGDLDLGFMNLPYAAESENPVIFVPEDGLAINAKSKNLEATKFFANWLFSKETYAKIQKAKGSMSALKGVGDLDPAYVNVPAWLATNNVISFGNTGPVPGPTWIALGNAAQKYTFDDKLDESIDQFIKEYDKTKAK
jgi:ABC-type glycerol-3-phosphate transport system substrate-binding protein